jgi:hypothetical protein
MTTLQLSVIQTVNYWFSVNSLLVLVISISIIGYYAYNCFPSRNKVEYYNFSPTGTN